MGALHCAPSRLSQIVQPGRLTRVLPMSDSSVSPQVQSLYSDHRGWLFGWLRRKTGCSEQAADLVQDTFVRVMTARDTSSLREPRAYLTTVAKGLMINWFQRQALERAYLDALAALPEPLAPSPEQRLLILESLHEIDAMLNSLPARVRRVFLLSQIEGLKYDEIARRLDVSLATVKRDMKQGFCVCLSVMDE